jgi:hypothetical protein
MGDPWSVIVSVLVQPRQHEAGQHDGVFRFIVTRLGDQPRPQPTDQRRQWLTRLPSLRYEMTCMTTVRS